MHPKKLLKTRQKIGTGLKLYHLLPSALSSNSSLKGIVSSLMANFSYKKLDALWVANLHLKSAILSCIDFIIPTDPNILKWLRYRDDILLLYKGTALELSSLVAKMNEIHPSLKFTMEVSDEEITYLDLKIFKGTKFQSSGILDTKAYTKPTETFQYLDRNSAHPLATFKAFMKVKS